MNFIYKIDRPPTLAACQPIMAQCGEIAFGWPDKPGPPREPSEAGRVGKGAAAE